VGGAKVASSGQSTAANAVEPSVADSMQESNSQKIETGPLETPLETSAFVSEQPSPSTAPKATPTSTQQLY